MKIEYHRETDSLYIRLAGKLQRIRDSAEITPGIVVDFAESGQVVGLDFERASERIDLTSVVVGEQHLASLL
jgi:uncharacterized protein YuzE